MSVRICEGCGQEFSSSGKIPRRFCCSKCAVDVRRDISNPSSRSRVYKKKSWNEKVFERPFDELSWDYKRVRVIIEQNSTCSKCNNDSWLGCQIALEIDHIDGDVNNNTRSNLTALCPNCHATTNTFRGRNKLRGSFPPDTIFYEKFKEVGNIRQTLLALGLAAKGGNYGHANRIIARFEPMKEIITVISI